MSNVFHPTEEQRAVIDVWGEGMAVMAGAGCGKTTTLVHKCVALLAQNSKARFAAVSFTERSAGDLRVKLSNKLLEMKEDAKGDPLSGHWVMTIHGLCGAIIREFPREAGVDGGETMLAESEAQVFWEQALEALWIDEIPEEIRTLVDTLLSRETRENLSGLFQRVRSLRSFGVLKSLASSKDPYSRALDLVGRYVIERFDRLKQRQGVLDFDDLERGADRALDDPKVRRFYQNRFDLVLVDEFQDTNPVQARILSRFVRADFSNLCVVGDPKQSIYRFRDADVSVFEEFCSKLPERRSLTWNFRSRPKIIEFSNAVCAPAFAAVGMNYEPLIAKREAREGLDSVVRLEAAGPEELAAWLRDEVSRGFKLDEAALLLRKIRGNERWLRALTLAGIPLALGSGGMFWEDPRVRELVAFLKWWDQPGHALSGAVFLRAPWVGIKDEVLDVWIKEDPCLVKPFFASEHGLARVLLPLRRQLLRPGELLLKLLVTDAVEDELGGPLLGLWHRVETLSARGMGFHEVVAELSHSIEVNRRERDVPPPRNLGQLRVLTLHGSKGLEFPHVILVDFGDKARAPDAPLLYWDRAQGALLGGRDEDGDRQHKNDPLEKKWKTLEDAKNLAESMRLFYVALTRAQERLIVVFPPVKKSPDNDVKTAYFKDHWRGWVECAGPKLGPLALIEPRKLQKRLEDGAVEATSLVAGSARRLQCVGAVALKVHRPRHSVTEWNLLSRCERAYEWSYIRQKALPEVATAANGGTPQVFESKNGLDQRELGTLVHACLERSDYAGLEALETLVGGRRFRAKPVIEWAQNSELMRASGVASRNIWNELAFELAVDDEVLVGAVDRIVRFERGGRECFAVLDFKVTAKPKEETELLERYRTQMLLYVAALRALEKPKGKTLELAQIEGYLVNITSAGVQEIRVPLSELDLSALAQKARRISEGAAGAPCPGQVCETCVFEDKGCTVKSP